MICIVLAAGYATRMYPLTENFPKPLLEVRNAPILNWLLRDIDQIGDISRVIIVSNHKYFQTFKAWTRKQHLKIQPEIIDDGSQNDADRRGAVADILFGLEYANEPSREILVLAADNLLTCSLAGFVDFYREIKRSCIMCYHEPSVENRRKTGIITMDHRRRVTSFEEKPDSPKSDLAVPPFYLYTPYDAGKIPSAVEQGCSTDAPGSLAKWMSEHAEIHAWEMPGKRYDIGSIAGYESVRTIFRPPR